MKLLRLGSTAVLFLLLGIAAPIYAQETHEQQEQKPERPEDRAQKPNAEKKDEKRQENTQKDERGQKKDDHQVAKGKNEKQEGKPTRIPEDRFRANYGRQHVFHVNQVTVVNGTPRFLYGGYSFVLVEPWPAAWYYTDDCYIDYVDGEYFLFDLLHPDARIGLTVIF
jgi:hypothetical protein